jgi:hypothetical protein
MAAKPSARTAQYQAALGLARLEPQQTRPGTGERMRSFLQLLVGPPALGPGMRNYSPETHGKPPLR